jgi:formylglycine-generating enzyme required for sulfatase activity
MRVATLVLLMLAAVGCGSGRVSAHGKLSGSVSGSGSGLLSKGAAASCTEPNAAAPLAVYGWDPGSRAKIATTAVDGTVVVRYERTGCDVLLEVLGRCVSKKAYYEYRAEPAERRVTALDRNQLSLNFAIAQARFTSELQAAEQLRADYASLGVESVAPGTVIDKNELEGECEGATHVVSEIRRGAFVLAAGSERELSSKLGLFDQRLRQNVQVLDEAGERSACSAQRDDLVPGCDVPLELVLTPLGKRYGGTVRAEASCSAEMVPLPAGKLAMGCHAGFENERPVHEVGLSAFCLDQSEVTNADYERCVKSSKCREPAGRCAGNRAADHPRTCVTPAEAEAYCQAQGKRLPTEAEWEYAARAGVEGWPFPTGINDTGSGESCSGRYGTCPVRSYRPEAFGLHDLAGNAREWTSGFYVDYALHARANPRGALSGTQVVARGGYYGSSASDTRSITRHVESPVGKPEIGFRCAKAR